MHYGVRGPLGRLSLEVVKGIAWESDCYYINCLETIDFSSQESECQDLNYEMFQEAGRLG